MYLTFFSTSSQRACSLGLLSMRNKTGDLFLSPFPSEANPMLWNSDFRGVMSHNDQTKLQKAQYTWPSSSFLQMQRIASAAEQGGAFLELCKRWESHRDGWSFVALLLQKNKENGSGRVTPVLFSHWLLCLKICHFLGEPRNGEHLLWIFSRIYTWSFWTPRCTVNECKL